MSTLRRLSLALAALRQLGLTQVGLFAWYQLGLRTGYLRRRTTDDGRRTKDDGRLSPEIDRLRSTLLVHRPFFEVPDREPLAAVIGDRASLLLAEAEEIVSGRVRMFGGEPVPLLLRVPGPREHWTVYERGAGDPGEDIKFVWEPGRFGWAYTLGRAYSLGGDERYAETFWERLEEFLEANPPNLGLHWVSAQEVALRLVALAFAAQLFASSPASTAERMERLAGAIASHAARIPPTLAYARAQNNNHLLSEAAGLYTAGLALPDHPQAEAWRKIGWRWLNDGLQAQIAPDGTYIQHSTNYHRLALQIALWCRRLARSDGQVFPEETQTRLAAATRWLLVLVNLETGGVPNLGPNDGASIQPLSTCPFSDYRPVVQAAARAFLGEPAFPAGPWDELGLWLGEGRDGRPISHCSTTLSLDPPHILRSPDHPSWAYFRVTEFDSRPGHADLFHLDLWWRGLNIAQDAGTFQYNAAPPWENGLAGTDVHNTVTVNGQNQMRRAGRFLWLDWAQGEIVAGEPGPGGCWRRLIARQNGYYRQGVGHEREVAAYSDGRWVVVDRLMRVGGSRLKVKPASWYLRPIIARLHWLLPDWDWRLEADGEQVTLILDSPHGPVELRSRGSLGSSARFQSEDDKGPGYRPEIPKDGTQGARQQDAVVYGNSHGMRRHPYILKTGSEAHPEFKVQVVRAGEVLYGDEQVMSNWGWASPTYGVKVPALSISISVENALPICLTSEWFFPPNDDSSVDQPGSIPTVG